MLAGRSFETFIVALAVSEAPVIAAFLAAVATGLLLRRLQCGERVEMPHSRPMPAVGSRCHELRIQDADLT